MTDFIAGLAGGCAGVLVGHPFDTVKVKLQTQDFRNPRYSGTFNCFRETVRNDGVRGLYRGMGSPLVGVGGVNAIIFGVQRATSRLFTDQDALSTHFAAGVCAGITQSVVCSPVELVKTRMQTQADLGTAKYKGSLDCLKQIFKTEGMRGVFRGQLTTVIREAPAFGTYFAVFEAAARLSSGTDSSVDAGSAGILFAGGLAGMASWTISYPVDVIKSRLQSDGAFGPERYKGIIDCCKVSYNEEGPRVFTRGLNSALLRAFPTNAATFFVVTTMTKHLQDFEADNEECISHFSDLIRSGEQIVSGAGFNQHDTNKGYCLEKIKENHMSQFLPVILKKSQEAILGLTGEALALCEGDEMDVDIHKALSAVLYVPIQRASMQRTSREWFARRGIVVNAEKPFKIAAIKHQLLSIGI